MKRTILRTLLFVLFSISITGSFANRQSSYNTAGEPGPVELISPSQARAIIQDILDVTGTKASFEVRAARIPNAAAATLKGKRYILYNPVFMAALEKASGSNRWAPISILAHEIGHHLYGHTVKGTPSQPAIELEADEFSGFVLRKMGASLEDAQLAMRVAASRRATATHPGRHDRLKAIANGWEKADAQLAGRGPAKQQQRVVTRARTEAPVSTAASAVLDERLIAYDVHFNGDPQGTYHVTVRNNLVKLSGNTLFVFGKLLSTDNQDFPMALTAGENVLLVSKKGQVISTEGKKLGYVTVRDRSN
jgi:hypothetical protein